MIIGLILLQLFALMQSVHIPPTIRGSSVPQQVGFEFSSTVFIKNVLQFNKIPVVHRKRVVETGRYHTMPSASNAFLSSTVLSILVSLKSM